MPRSPDQILAVAQMRAAEEALIEAGSSVEALMDLAPPVAHLLRDGGETMDVEASAVAVGSRLLVKPGERIPLDGVVVDGESDVDQAPITGESVPVPKASGAEVFAGTINGDGTLFVETTKDAQHTTLARIIRMVGEAHSRRAPSEQWVDRFARFYTPVVMGLALAVLAVPPLAFGAPFSEWLYRALVLLVIACPCALVISTPVTIVAGLTAAARQGVLVKGGRYLEAPAHLRAIAFDKTGTLTEGRPRVVELAPLDGHSEAELLARAAALEGHSDHPLARAILAAWKRLAWGELPRAVRKVTFRGSMPRRGPIRRSPPFRLSAPVNAPVCTRRSRVVRRSVWRRRSCHGPAAVSPTPIPAPYSAR